MGLLAKALVVQSRWDLRCKTKKMRLDSGQFYWVCSSAWLYSLENKPLSQGVIHILSVFLPKLHNLWVFFFFFYTVDSAACWMNMNEKIIGHNLSSILCHNFKFMTLRGFKGL